MGMTPEQMDRKIDEHFGFEAGDDVDGVLATLAPDAEHDIVGWPPGPTHGRAAARPFYQAMFADLAESRVECRKRLYGENFHGGRIVLAGRAPGRPFGLDGRGRPLEFRLLHVVEFAPDGDISRENVWVDLAAIIRQLPQELSPWTSTSAGRRNQRRRTRKDLLRAASRLMRQGRTPSLEEIADEALVSRATAYRYFSSMEALLLEASIDVAVPGPEELFAADGSTEPVARLGRADKALHDMIIANEAPLRMMLSQSLQRVVRGESGGDIPTRQNRRTPLIEAALEPARHEFAPEMLATLSRALALVVGVEAMVVFKDVLQLDDAEARAVKL